MKPVIVANWKMNVSVESSIALARALVPVVAGAGDDFSLILCPSFVSLPGVAREIQQTAIELGAQDVSALNRGARTGEVSPLDLRDVGCSYCLIGHSERRLYHHETDDSVHSKVITCVRAGLTPIVCVGEQEGGISPSVVAQQVKTALADLPLGPSTRVLIAYEPLWAIGTGSPAEPDDIEQCFAMIRNELDDAGIPRSAALLLYGGSVSSSSAGRLLASTSAQGFLVGGESQEERRFVSLLNALRKSL